MANKYAARTDNNQSEIVEALRKAGVTVMHTHQLKNAFDILCGFRGNSYIIEIKNKDLLPKKFWGMAPHEQRKYLEKLLTKGEKDCMRDFQRVGVRYHIVYDIKSAFAALGLENPQLF